MKTDNELIAEFMGVQVYQTYAEMQNVPLDELEQWSLPEQLNYHSNWSELMPVVENIFSMWESELPSEEYLKVTMLPIYTDIQVVYRRVVDFIKWYNESSRV